MSHYIAPVKKLVTIGMTQSDPYKGCYITFQLPFSVYLRGKLIQVKIPYINGWTWITLPLTKSINFESEKIFVD